MTWNDILAPAFAMPKVVNLKKFIRSERLNKKIYPDGDKVFRAFDMTPYEKVKIVILGQDPYNKPGQADGLAFSANDDVERPKSLEVILKEIYNDLNIQYNHNVTYKEFFPSNKLDNWTRMGVLLLNTILTVEDGKPLSHKGAGWELVMDAVFKALDEKEGQVAYFLWGKDAQSYEGRITNKKHIIFKAPHPAAELYNDTGHKFTGCRHFSIMRDIIPILFNKNIYPHHNLEQCFNKEKAKEILTKYYPIEAKFLCDYIDHDLIIHIPINKERYFNNLRKIETMFSTKQLTNEKILNIFK